VQHVVVIGSTTVVGSWTSSKSYSFMWSRKIIASGEYHAFGIPRIADKDAQSENSHYNNSNQKFSDTLCNIVASKLIM
jgi:hypothetical protein